MDLIGILYHTRMEEASAPDIYPDEFGVKRGEYCKLIDEIAKLLPEDVVQLLLDLDRVGSELLGICEETGYKMGFSDAFEFSEEVMPKTA
ncbi:hypothetical protein [Desulfosporosinus sp. FKB]|uniref:hypothetical protein n=1 Tax=Desulfosporosinus sp. FKB TaxID=1969835 RepID=UPI000B49C2DE|nr:hypothetical protein [Desulfosporosinus sp. FKB]